MKYKIMLLLTAAIATHAIANPFNSYESNKRFREMIINENEYYIDRYKEQLQSPYNSRLQRNDLQQQIRNAELDNRILKTWR